MGLRNRAASARASPDADESRRLRASLEAAERRCRELERERREALERAERERAERVRRANEALASAIAALHGVTDLGAFLGHTLRAMTRQIGAERSSVWRYDRRTELCELIFVYDREKLISGPASDHPYGRTPRKITAEAIAAIRGHSIRAAQPWVEPVLNDPTLDPPHRAFLLAQGVQALIGVPMALGGDLVGVFTLWWTRPEPPPEEDLPLIQAVADQATLAVQVMRLSERARATARSAAAAEERARLAHDLHDSLAHCLSGAIVQLQAADELLRTDPATARACLTRAQSLSRQGLTNVRAAVAALQPAAEEHSDLAQRVRAAIEEVTGPRGPRLSLKLEGAPYPVRPDVGLQVLQIVQEALSNAIRYAGAAQVRVVLAYDPAALSASIADDGAGFDPQAAARSGGFGLAGMRRRAERVGGAVDIESAVGRGTRIGIRVPGATFVKPA